MHSRVYQCSSLDTQSCYLPTLTWHLQFKRPSTSSRAMSIKSQGFVNCFAFSKFSHTMFYMNFNSLKTCLFSATTSVPFFLFFWTFSSLALMKKIIPESVGICFTASYYSSNTHCCFFSRHHHL